MVLLSYSPNMILPRIYTAYLGPIRFTLDNMDFTLDNMEFTLDNMTPVSKVQRFELNVNYFLNIFYAFVVVSIRTNKKFLNLN